MIKQFFKEYIVWYATYLGVMFLFFLNFWLYHLPLIYFANTLALNLVVLVIISLWRYFLFRQKMLVLTHFVYDSELEDFTDPSDIAYRTVIFKLRHAANQKELEITSQKDNLESLVKMWTHQMKVPLSAISLMAQTDQLTPEETKRQVLRLENYLDTLINYIKFKQHQDDFRFERVSARKVVAEVVKKYCTACLAKQLSVTITGDTTFKTDKKWLSFALSQIFDNAIKYSHNNAQIKITITETQVTISDDGIGILDEDLPRLFDEGFTGFNGHKYQKATGLGLYMTKQVLDKLNFSIKVTSQIAKGTDVTISSKQKL
ncbi:sensor histidine kinase [Streptococcus sciuri]|uniref:histidine kinase n=1 Tax=Streptococcus sciuri TaxID=2973939 RepID=A0ABT2F6Z4_9STRE|nr:sensor histidine kinase [Streptococcus sciuri]MCS4487587.1 sensor histidine kinase [Streptococcus sciuri]